MELTESALGLANCLPVPHHITTRLVSDIKSVANTPSCITNTV